MVRSTSRSNRPIADGPFSTGPFVAGVRSETITLTQGGLLSHADRRADRRRRERHAPMASPSSPPTARARSPPRPAFVRNGSGANTLAFTYTVAAGRDLNGALSLRGARGLVAALGHARPGRLRAHEHGHALRVRPDDHRDRPDRSEGQTVVITYGARANGGPGATAPTASGVQSWVAKSRALAGGTLTPLASSPQITVLAPDGSGTIEPSRPSSTRAAPPTRSPSPTPPLGPMVNGSLSLDVPRRLVCSLHQPRALPARSPPRRARPRSRGARSPSRG